MGCALLLLNSPSLEVSNELSKELYLSCGADKLAALRNHKLGKALVEGILFKTCAMENSWKLFQDILAGGITNANGDFEQIIKGQSGEPERPTGELLRRLLERFPNKFSSKDAKNEAREIMEARALMNEIPADKVKRLERMLAEARKEMMREAVIMKSA